MKVAIYARVSTTDQHCEMQLRELRDYVTRRGWELAAEYVDAGISGTKTSRPQLDKLMTDARKRKFDCVCVWKLDRWGRSVSHCISSIQELTSLGITWCSVTQGLDTGQSNPTSNLLLHILAAVAEFEREMIRDRVTSGLKSARRRGTRSGKAIGRPVKVWRRDQAEELRAAGMSTRAIARALKIPEATIRLAFRSAQKPLPQTPISVV